MADRTKIEWTDATWTPPDHDFGDGYVANRVGKRAAGHLLDGCEHREVPG